MDNESKFSKAVVLVKSSNGALRLKNYLLEVKKFENNKVKCRFHEMKGPICPRNFQIYSLINTSYLYSELRQHKSNESYLYVKNIIDGNIDNEEDGFEDNKSNESDLLKIEGPKPALLKLDKKQIYKIKSTVNDEDVDPDKRKLSKFEEYLRVKGTSLSSKSSLSSISSSSSSKCSSTSSITSSMSVSSIIDRRKKETDRLLLEWKTREKYKYIVDLSTLDREDRKIATEVIKTLNKLIDGLVLCENVHLLAYGPKLGNTGPIISVLSIK